MGGGGTDDKVLLKEVMHSSGKFSCGKKFKGEKVRTAESLGESNKEGGNQSTKNRITHKKKTQLRQLLKRD